MSKAKLRKALDAADEAVGDMLAEIDDWEMDASERSLESEAGERKLELRDQLDELQSALAEILQATAKSA